MENLNMTPNKKPQSPVVKDGQLEAIQQLAAVIEAHDQVIFQSIIGMNVIQRILIDKGIVTIEEVDQIATEEAEAFKMRIEQAISN